MKINLELPDNCTLQFDNGKVYLSVGINVSNEAKQYLSSNNLFRGKKYWFYSLRKPLNNVSKKEIFDTYNVLLARCMFRCREAKIKYLKSQQEQLKLKFNE